ncbi:hypothetical protein Vadar_019661 [Vaccinium darrowii]|uniref:Uncharacterized protein n=1 Tax=Vaccinium darrowii TaxID=229202 RepID=A0ACB7Y119_9ERIC|nr:hypothetical protein Vadar_019661 [Vaccinium darrowii]
MIDVRVTDIKGIRSRVTGIYASTDYYERKDLWQRLSVKLIADSEPWSMVGDFNCILSNEEKDGGQDKETWELNDFRNFIDNNDLIDIGFVGFPFTWNNKRHGWANIRQRLDRAIVNPQWRMKFPNGTLLHLPPGGSDHCPVLVRFEGPHSYKISRFIFYPRWAAKEACGRIVSECWSRNIRGSRWFRIQQKIKMCRQKLRHWRASNNLNSRSKMNDLKERLELENERVEFDAEEYRRIEEGMAQACLDEEKYWKDKAKVSWLRLGDKNTAFFHAKTIQRRVQNRIHGIEDKDGIWKEDRRDVERIIRDYFQHIFSSSNPTLFKEVLVGIRARVTNAMNRKLVGPISMSEDFHVCEFINRDSSSWKEDMVRQAFNQEDAEIILGIPLPRNDMVFNSKKWEPDGTCRLAVSDAVDFLEANAEKVQDSTGRPVGKAL